MLIIKKVLCPVAGTPESESVLDVALDIAQRHGAQLTVLNVAPLNIIDLMRPRGHLGEDEDVLSSQVEERLDRHSKQVLANARTYLGDNPANYERIIGHPGRVICDVAEQAQFDLVVIGHRKHSLLRGMLGSVTTQVVHHSPCPVLVVKDTRQT